MNEIELEDFFNKWALDLELKKWQASGLRKMIKELIELLKT